jgi:hypothetical protein
MGGCMQGVRISRQGDLLRYVSSRLPPEMSRSQAGATGQMELSPMPPSLRGANQDARNHEETRQFRLIYQYNTIICSSNQLAPTTALLLLGAYEILPLPRYGMLHYVTHRALNFIAIPPFLVPPLNSCPLHSRGMIPTIHALRQSNSNVMNPSVDRAVCRI